MACSHLQQRLTLVEVLQTQQSFFLHGLNSHGHQHTGTISKLMKTHCCLVRFMLTYWWQMCFLVGYVIVRGCCIVAFSSCSPCLMVLGAAFESSGSEYHIIPAHSHLHRLLLQTLTVTVCTNLSICIA